MNGRDESKPDPLDYWNATGRRPTPTIVLGLSFVGGMMTSMAAVFLLGVGGFCLLGGIDAPPSHSPNQRLGTGLIAAFWFGLIVVCFIWAIRKVRDERNLSLEWRRDPRRYFVLGVLIGCGTAGLIEGLCFGAQAFS